MSFEFNPFKKEEHHVIEDPFMRELLQDAVIGATAGGVLERNPMAMGLGAVLGVGAGVFRDAAIEPITGKRGEDETLVGRLFEDSAAGASAGLLRASVGGFKGGVIGAGLGATIGLGLGAIKEFAIDHEKK